MRIKRGKKAYWQGVQGEYLAAGLLRLKGYRLLARRWRSARGEIDIIARKSNLIAIVEIKSRPNLQQAMEALSPAQQKRIIAAADLWLAQQPDYAQLSLRFDLVAICPRKWPRHIKACWTA
ncbi:MAG: YraN family protein [Candidatus Tokpelaia sp.]|uniref:YraN family protein n=1 Tax=Candidatus Tokpelaia sp. TaxID=2233777 RepID=UPI00123BDECC|nr:YraN family protein [Candidatus Tokpelaia sp.]KAA6205683.1 MAG: YraN family protein [Candidatus Tokpelaia sp.]KAA6207466.1 MAG: YraN family protein [Candidatus Tokpelaia sp.]KAA6405259.1 YraN family protein [Candidatus Tokpelaia sp.]